MSACQVLTTTLLSLHPNRQATLNIYTFEKFMFPLSSRIRSQIELNLLVCVIIIDRDKMYNNHKTHETSHKGLDMDNSALRVNNP